MKNHMLDVLTTSDPIWRPYAFDHVTIEGHTDAGVAVAFSVLGVCWSEYSGGPNLCHLADAAGAIFGAGFYGLKQCRALGFRPNI